MRNVMYAQEQFRRIGHADEDGDDVGEFGSFAEMAGATAGRAETPLASPVLHAPFGRVDRRRVERNGYYYAIFLPSENGGYVAERTRGGVWRGEVSPNGAERRWVAYAWPMKPGYDVQRTFFASSEGEILATTGYAGENAPAPTAALRPGSAAAACGARGRDGRLWKQCG